MPRAAQLVYCVLFREEDRVPEQWWGLREEYARG